MSNCVEEIAAKMVPMLKSGKSESEVAREFENEDGDLVGEALVEAVAMIVWEDD